MVLEVQKCSEKNAEFELRINDLELERFVILFSYFYFICFLLFHNSNSLIFNRDELMYESSTAKVGVMNLTKELTEKNSEILLIQQKYHEVEQQL